MSRYQGRHAPRHAAPRGRAAVVRDALSQPLIGGPLALVAVGATAAGIAFGGIPDANAGTTQALTLSNEAIAQSDAQSRQSVEDAARLAAQRDEAVASRAARGERERLAAVAAAKAKAEAKARAEAKAKAAAAAAKAKAKAAAEAKTKAKAAAAAKTAAEKKRKELAARKTAVLANAQKDPKAVAETLVAENGWGSGEFQCLVNLWQKESGWNYRATNASSGAYGIPQSLPGSKMATFGADWQTNPTTQIKWGLDYIKGRYGSPCGAWGHSQAMNWY